VNGKPRGRAPYNSYRKSREKYEKKNGYIVEGEEGNAQASTKKGVPIEQKGDWDETRRASKLT